MRCCAEECQVENSETDPTGIAPGLRAYCAYHATGKHASGSQLYLRKPCACAKSASGFECVVGGYSARHTERNCFERTIAASPEDVTAPEARPGSASSPGQRQIVPAQKCACGKRMDGTLSAYPGFTESHSLRECIEQTTR